MPRSHVGVVWSSLTILSRRLQVSSSHPVACFASLCVSCCWNRWWMELYPFCAAFFEESFAWRYSRCASVFPWRAPWRVPFLKTDYGMVSASNLSLVSSGRGLRSSNLNNMNTLDFGEISRTTRGIPRSPDSVLLFFSEGIVRAIILQIGD